MDCRRCNEAQKSERGCKRSSIIPDVWSLGDWKFDRCPLKVVSQQSFDFIRAFNFYKAGSYPNPGGWADQPLKLIEAILFIQAEINSAEESKDRK